MLKFKLCCISLLLVSRFSIVDASQMPTRNNLQSSDVPGFTHHFYSIVRHGWVEIPLDPITGLPQRGFLPDGNHNTTEAGEFASRNGDFMQSMSSLLATAILRLNEHSIFNQAQDSVIVATTNRLEHIEMPIVVRRSFASTVRDFLIFRDPHDDVDHVRTKEKSCQLIMPHEIAFLNAAKNGDLEMINSLLQTPDFNCNKEDCDGNTAVELAELNGHKEIVTMIRKYVLLQRGVKERAIDTRIIEDSAVICPICQRKKIDIDPSEYDLTGLSASDMVKTAEENLNKSCCKNFICRNDRTKWQMQNGKCPICRRKW